MKKITLFLLSAVMLFYLSACSLTVKENKEETPTSIPEVHYTQVTETAPEISECKYIGNKISKKFHRPDCRTLPSEKNRVEFSSRDNAVSSGFTPCGNCKP